MSVFEAENAKAREQRRRAKLFPDLLTALEGLNPNLHGKGAHGAGYWYPIHMHPYHKLGAVSQP